MVGHRLHSVKTLRYLRSGWVEIVTATLLTVLSIQAGALGRIPWTSVVLDFAAFVVVLLALTWLRVGIGLTLVVTLAALAVVPSDAGLSMYVCMLPALTAIRRDSVPLAVLVTAVNVGVGWILSFYLAGDSDDPVSIVLTWLILYAIVWGIGLGMRASARMEATRVASRYRRQQLELALDLHDSVCRDLSMLVLQADTVTAAGQATPEQLETLAQRARSANQSVREVARLLGGATRSSVPEVRLESALRSGTHELRSLGFTVQARVALLDGLPEQVDTAAGRILQEALHNVAKHGSAQEPCIVDVERGADAIVMTVTNLPGRGRAESHARMGIRTMRERAAVVGGSVNAREVAGKWVCAISLPVPTRAESAPVS